MGRGGQHRYLHRILKKTSYELLTGKKPNISYFRVFGSKCFILIKRGRKSKFAPKTVEGFLLGYDSNTRAYRVFNKSTELVEVFCNAPNLRVEFFFLQHSPNSGVTFPLSFYSRYALFFFKYSSEI